MCTSAVGYRGDNKTFSVKLELLQKQDPALSKGHVCLMTDTDEIFSNNTNHKSNAIFAKIELEKCLSPAVIYPVNCDLS